MRAWERGISREAEGGGYCVKRGLNVCIRPGRAELMEERWAVGELNFHLIGKGTE